MKEESQTSSAPQQSILDIFASVVTRCPTAQPVPFDSGVERRVSCHRCGNIRKKKIPCVHASCPHIYCGRCAEKMKEEYGEAVFKDGCPVCLELCCCSNKSFSCSRYNHCYRKCPASKAKSCSNQSDKISKMFSDSQPKYHHDNFQVPRSTYGHGAPSKNNNFYQAIQANILEELYNDQTTAAVALCSLIGGNANANRSSPTHEQSVRIESSGDSASDEDSKPHNRPFKKRNVTLTSDAAVPKEEEDDQAKQATKRAARNVSPEPSPLLLMNRAIEANNNREAAIAAMPSTTPSTSAAAIPAVKDIPGYSFIPNSHGIMFQQYPMLYQFGPSNTIIMNNAHPEDHSRRNPGGLEFYGGDYVPYPYARGYSHFPGLHVANHMPGADVAAMPQQFIMGHPAFSGYPMPNNRTTYPKTGVDTRNAGKIPHVTGSKARK